MKISSLLAGLLLLLTPTALLANTSLAYPSSPNAVPGSFQLARYVVHGMSWKCYANCRPSRYMRPRRIGLVGHDRAHAINRIANYCRGGYRLMGCRVRHSVGRMYSCVAGGMRYKAYNTRYQRARAMAYRQCRHHHSHRYCRYIRCHRVGY